jgi:hypothetical protein
MKNLFRLLFSSLLVLLLLATNNSFSQVRIGIKGGSTYSVMSNTSQYIIGNEHTNGYLAGIFAEFSAIGELYLQPGIIFSTRGTKYTVGNNTVGITEPFPDYQFTGLYASMPLDLTYKIDLGPFKVLISAGPSLTYAIKGQWTTSFETSSAVHFGNSTTDDFKPFEYGVNAGGGVEIGRFQLLSQFYQGLNPLSASNPESTEQKFRVISFSAAFLFGDNSGSYKPYKSRYWKPHRKHMGPRRYR